MKQKITLFTLVFLCSLGNLFADPVDKKTAVKAAALWMQQNAQQRSSHSQKIQNIKEVYFNKSKVYYIVNYQGGGYVIVSADDATQPVLAYSDRGTLEATEPNTQHILAAYKSFVYESAQVQKAGKQARKNNRWNALKQASGSRTKVIAPFMDDILYTQSSGFNKYCPSDADGQAIVGCVATAMAQVMRYWEFPARGRSQHSYTHNKYGNISVNFANQSYDWANMSKTRADDENAKLSYHCGVAVSMSYGTSANGGSGAYSRDALAALKKYFKYNQSAQMIYRSRYSDADWNAVIKQQLDQKRPVLYSGRSKNLQDPNAGGAGHLFALDGYDTTDQGDYFHINWGWAGRSNGYFYLTEMITHGGKYNWIDSNAIMIDVYPTNVAPSFVSTPSNFVRIDQAYTYNVQVIDENKRDQVTLTLTQKPNWLQFNNTSGNYTLSGTPTEADAGKHEVVLTATDGQQTTEHRYTLYVLTNKEVVANKIIDFETADFSQANFASNQTHPFVIGTEGGNYSISKNIQDNQSSVLELTQAFETATEVQFDYAVSSESGYDYLIFAIDGKEQNKWSGEQAWTTVSFTVPAGNHKLTWTYRKDASVKKGKDQAKIDNIRYQYITTDTEKPSIPAQLTAADVTENSLTLQWQAATDNVKVKQYEVYQNNQLVSTTSKVSLPINDLTANTEYQYTVKSVDFAGNSSDASNALTLTTQGSQLNYCDAKGQRVSYEWIDSVSFGAMTNTSGANGGYADFSSMVATVTANSEVTLSLKAGFSSSTYKEHFSVWIDYNQNGTYEAEEQIVNDTTDNANSKTYAIQIPSGATLGMTKMRVVMQYNQAPAACGTFVDGEVEDYAVNIVQTAARYEPNQHQTSQPMIDLQVYPNPASHFVNISSDFNLQNARYEIIDTNGRIVKSNSFRAASSIDIRNLPIGSYFVKVYNDTISFSRTLLKTKR